VDPIVAGLRNEMADIKRDLEALNRRAMDVGSRLEKLAAGKAA